MRFGKAIKSSLLFAGVYVTAFQVFSCSRSKPSEDDAAPAQETVSYNVNLSKVELGLTGASKFTIRVEGCASGYSGEAHETSPSLVVYKFDRNCLAKLTAMTVGGVDYVSSSSDPFDSYASGDKATFVDAAGGPAKIFVQVLNQLDNPIPSSTPSHGVDYAFSTIQQGVTQECTGDCVKNNYSISVNGIDAPAYDVKKFSFVDMNQNGAGVFSFEFECEQPVVGSDTAATCKGAPMSGLKYKLIVDTFGSSLTMDDAANVMMSGTVGVDSVEVVAAGANPDMPNGGFVSKMMVGPDQMHLNPNMMMILETGDTSFKYWNVDVTPIFQD
jgi:hypothetical protein